VQLPCPNAAKEPTEQLTQLADESAPEAGCEVPAGHASHEPAPVTDW
jgi:hypothetical protein